jgi:hypothetical protein
MNPRGARGAAVGLGTALQAGRSRVRFPIVLLELFFDIILLALGLSQPFYGNEYQKYFLEVKAAGE